MGRERVIESTLAEWATDTLDTLKDMLLEPIETYWDNYQKILPDEIESALIIVQIIARRGAPIDTGTLRKRIDMKVEGWNLAWIGVMEPHMTKFYDSNLHAPTANISKYTGRVVPEFEISSETGRAIGHRYAYKVHKNQPFLNHIVKEEFNKRMLIGMGRFNKKQFNL